MLKTKDNSTIFVGCWAYRSDLRFFFDQPLRSIIIRLVFEVLYVCLKLDLPKPNVVTKWFEVKEALLNIGGG